jgi:hypothetical protein
MDALAIVDGKFLSRGIAGPEGLVRVPPVFFRKTDLKERIKLSAFFSERVPW